MFYDDPADEQVQDTFKAVLRIYNNARKCFESDKPEASWGEEVVRPLLDLAASRTDGRVVIENVFVSYAESLASFANGIQY